MSLPKWDIKISMSDLDIIQVKPIAAKFYGAELKTSGPFFHMA